MTTSVTATGRPAPVSTAVKLMYAIAALDVVSLLLTVTNTGALRDQARALSPGLSSSQLDAAVTVSIVIGAVSALIGITLWVLCAVFTGRGRKWARIVATVLSVLVVLAALLSFSGGLTLPEVVGLVVAVCAIGVVFLLYRPVSNAFFAHGGVPRGQVAEPGYPGYPPAQQP